MSAGCPHCGSLEIGKSWGETRYACGMSSGYPPEVRFSECLRREAAALRRQVEEQGDAIPEFDVNKLDGLEGAWAEGNLRVYIAGARAGWGKCASLIRTPPGDVVATPPNADTVPPVETEFKREDRYIVIKRSDLERHATPAQLRELERTCEMIRFGRMNEGKRRNSYVVVADDWPEYEETWARIQARMTGTQIQDIRPLSPGEVVATPQDTVVVGREEWEILRDGFGLLRTAWNISGFNERLSAQADALIERHDTLRSGEAPAQRGEG